MDTDEAIKCKHCGEWLEKKNVLKDTFKKTSNLIKGKIEERKKEKTKHLYLPTPERPLIIENIKVFPDSVLIDDKRYQYDQLKNIVFYAGSSTYNFVTISEHATFHLYFTEKDSETEACIKIMCWLDDKEAIIKSNAGKKTKEQVSLMYKFISESTFKTRLTYYMKEIFTKKSFSYADIYTFHENGDVYKEDKYRDNIKKAFNENRLEWGSSWKGLKSSSFDPYEFTMYKNPGAKVKLMGIELAKKTRIHTTVDHDVFSLLIIAFLEKGNFLAITQ